MEYFSRCGQKWMLTDIRTNRKAPFSLVEIKQASWINHPVVSGFDMSKLEIEYDYDTSDEQMMKSRSMLESELFQAIEFFVKEDPIKLVSNLLV
jgi:hypothetical protein